MTPQEEADAVAKAVHDAIMAYGTAKRNHEPPSVTVPLLSALANAAVAYVPVDSNGKPIDRSR